MKTLFWKKINHPTVKAGFSLEWEDRLIIHDCTIREAGNGKLYIKFPSRTYMENGIKKYQPIVEAKNELIVKISELAVHDYEELK